MPYSALAAHPVGIQEILELPSLWLPPEATMVEAATVMSQIPHHSIFVVRQSEGHQGEYLGILTKQEILLAVSQGLDLAQTPVSHCMVPYASHSPQPHSAQLRWETYLTPLMQIHQELGKLRCQNRLQVFHQILAHLGRAIRATRIYLFEAHGEAQGQLQFSQRAAWYAEDRSPAMSPGASGNGTSGNGTSVNGTSGNGTSVNTVYLDCLPKWHGALAQGKAIASKVAELPEAPRQILEAQGIGSILVLPLRPDQSAMPLAHHPFYGFIGVEDLAQGRSWDNGEMPLLEMVAASLSLVYEHQQIQQAPNQTQAAELIEFVGQSCVLAVGKDITDRQHMEDALRNSEARFRAIFEQANVGICLANLDGQMIEANPGLCHLVGYDREELAQMTFQELTHPEDLSLDLAQYQLLLQGKTTSFSLEKRYVHRDGHDVWVNLTVCMVKDGAGKPQFSIGVSQDISDRKATELALRDSHHWIANILESITDAFFALDEQWRFIYVNQRAEQLLMRQRQDLLGQVIWEEFPEAIGTRFETEYHRAMQKRITVTFEEYYSAFDLWFEAHAYPTGEGLAVYFQDISERKRTDEQLQHQMRREQSLNRVLQTVRQSLDLDTIFATAVLEVTSLLPTDLVTIGLYSSKFDNCQVVAEHQSNGVFPSLIGMVINKDVPGGTLRSCQVQGPQISPSLTLTEPGSQKTLHLSGNWLIIPFHTYEDTPHGCLSLLRGEQQGTWQGSEIDLVKIVADQLAIAVQQANTLDQAQQELQERQRAEARLKEAQRITHTGNWEMDMTHHQMTWSEEMFRIFGLPSQTSTPHPLTILDYVHPEDRDNCLTTLEHILTIGQPCNLELRLIRPDGTLRYVQVTGQAHCNNHQVSRIYGTLMDITERKCIEEQLVYEALHDSLTGAPNRTCFMEHLNQAIERARTDLDYTFAVLFIDLDRFKVINDSLGHLVGDQLLIECTQRLQSVVGHRDLMARLGGDEFAVLIHVIETTQEALDVAARIHEVLRLPFELQNREIFISASIGISSNLTGAYEAVDFLRDADTAMYRAKERGRGQSTLFDPSMYEQVNTQLTLENDLRRALDRQELELYFQPIYELHTPRLIGFEALVRWHHPRWGCIQPSTFIPLAEETGLILPIGTWTIRAACQQLVQWQQRFPQAADLVVSVNLSAKQLETPHLIQEIDEILLDLRLASAHLRLEMTESALIENPETTEMILTELKARGIQLCIDDFGTGYSSLNVVHRFPVHILKIDRSFVSRMDEDERGVAMVQAILALAQSLGMVAIAEGIETAEQSLRLKSLNCTHGQGYWFARPQPAQEAEKLIPE